jgi:ABC-2 type transport system ATP-binding protein
MARRIGLAQALINDPDLLILDEPTTGLDPVGTRQIKDLIAFLNRQKRKTVLLCSHLLADVEDVCQQVTILYGGRRQAAGDIGELLSQKDLTQITTERLNEQTIARIQKMVEEQEAKQVVNVSTPSDKLETFFLRIVKQAQEAKQQTSGVTAGGKIAEFLTFEEQEPEAVVDSLMAAAKPIETKPEKPISQEPPPEASDEVIEELITPATTPETEASGQDESMTLETSNDRPTEGDKEIIDRLIERADEQDQE